MPANQTKTLGNDDQSFWGLASLSAYEAKLPEPTSGSWLDFAKNVFDTQTVRWDTQSCGGGLRWQIFTFNNGYNYKNSASNGQLFLLAARLAEQTQNATYADWANKVYAWSADIGLVTDDQQVYDGTDDNQNCSTINHIQWTANHATFMEGAAIMYKMVSFRACYVMFTLMLLSQTPPRIGPTLSLDSQTLHLVSHATTACSLRLRARTTEIATSTNEPSRA